MSNSVKVPTWYWIVAVIALIWNLMGVMAFVSQSMMTPEMLELLPDDQREAYQNTPMWSTIAFATAVFGGTLGSITLLMRNKLSNLLFMISFLGIMIQQVYNFVVIDSIAMFGGGAVIMPIMVVVGGVLLIMLARKAQSNHWFK